jgi:DNA-binding NarL/FixJ family response regulator
MLDLSDDIELGHGSMVLAAAQMILDVRDVPVLFLSSHTEKEIVERTENISSYGYVVKNSSFTVLDASIKMALRLFDANRRLQLQALVLDQISDHITVTDLDGIITYINQAQ